MKTGWWRISTVVVFVLVAVLVLAGATAAASDGSGAGGTTPGHGNGGGSGAGGNAGGGRGGPLQIRWAWLGQQGQQLVWRVELAQPFSASALARDHASLCLLIERLASGTVWQQVCVTGPPTRSGTPRLVYKSVSGTSTGPPHEAAATFSEPDSSALVASFLPEAVGLGYGSIRWQTISAATSGACASSRPASGCSALFPSRPRLVRLHTPVVVGCVPSGRSLVYQGPSSQREIALTFDDGPWNDPPTAEFLSMLEREHVPATFFEIGRQISTYDPGGALERRMLADGDMIGDHTWSHPVMTSLSPTAQRAQLLATASAINQATRGFTPCLWRPPYGAVNGPLVSLARSLGLLTIMWDVDPRDWALPGVGAIYSNVVDNARNGAIVIHHFGGGPRYETLSAVPQEINTLRARGYRFVTVAELLGLRLVYR